MIRFSLEHTGSDCQGMQGSVHGPSLAESHGTMCACDCLYERRVKATTMMRVGLTDSRTTCVMKGDDREVDTSQTLTCA